MRFEPLRFEHRDLLQQRLREITVPLSEYSFPNLYLFRAVHAYEVMNTGDVFIKGKSYDGHSFLMPTAPLDRVDLAALTSLLGTVDFLYPIPEEWLSALDPDAFEVTFNEGDMDYLYTVQKMSTFAGRRLHKKRNLLKQFLQAYRHEALPLTEGRIGDARFILDAWLAETGLAAPKTDYDSCREALDRYEALALCGGIYYANAEPAGFVIGEELNDETFVLHFAKARTRFKGVYQYVYNNFAKVLPPKYRFLNLEQDLNKENLRVFKSSYVPDAMIKKARVRARKPAGAV